MLGELLYHLKRPFHFIKTGLLKALPAQLKYHFPARRLKIIAITGTDGKTTSSTLLYQVLKQAGKKVALLSTVAAYIGDEEIDTGFHVTTPEPRALQEFFRKMVDQGYEYLVLEATSHGIYQYRLWGIEPLLAGLTNITREHLDYHLNYELYLQAKAELLGKAKIAVINADDEQSFSKVKKELKNKHTKVLTYSLGDTLPKVVQQAINKRFSQVFNQLNSRLVYTLAKQLEVSDEDIAQGIKVFKGIPGRMETVGEEKGIKVIVDFAHTPNGLYQALTTLRQELNTSKSKGRLIAVFGCAGARDIGKRPLMGKIGAEVADFAIFTGEDPRNEDVWSIIHQMKSNLENDQDKVLSIANRRDAIFYAITKIAKKGDLIGLFGKGHEKSMCYGTIEYPWSDISVASEALAVLKNGQVLSKKLAS